MSEATSFWQKVGQWSRAAAKRTLKMKHNTAVEPIYTEGQFLKPLNTIETVQKYFKNTTDQKDACREPDSNRRKPVRCAVKATLADWPIKPLWHRDSHNLIGSKFSSKPIMRRD
ncbi:hypothetical protein GLAREA_11431 [Glarea lozoyensis ATCC 20868]|uniref:Uncharacterized protein n=1 Tax=Glarea lozoyensis (strain ATCC 20868 / MF5171) TaxID=1116229 RepID=S3CG25_GLAL2|nr:uncharacterized protein GLAREA_11431 [Glarea lozoyensis ATCC 20868]EPE24850.1 hypothetical protein GLAREA_11431 [Glarea lozoyensis ATCC 20868]